MTPRLHLLGAGRTARTLARLWQEAGVLRIGQVRNRSLDSALRAVAWIGQGRAVEEFAAIDPEDVPALEGGVRQLDVMHAPP